MPFQRRPPVTSASKSSISNFEDDDEALAPLCPECDLPGGTTSEMGERWHPDCWARFARTYELYLIRED